MTFISRPRTRQMQSKAGMKKEWIIFTILNKVIYLVHSLQKQTFSQRRQGRHCVIWEKVKECQELFKLLYSRRKRRKYKKVVKDFTLEPINVTQIPRLTKFSQKLICKFYKHWIFLLVSSGQQEGESHPRLSQILRCLLKYLSYIYALNTPHKEITSITPL